MVALIRRERIPLTASTSRDDYECALRQALNAARDDAFLRTMPPEFDWDQFIESSTAQISEHTLEMREFVMAENLLWVRSERERFSSSHTTDTSSLRSRYSRAARCDLPIGTDPPVSTCDRRWAATWSSSVHISATARVSRPGAWRRRTPRAWMGCSVHFRCPSFRWIITNCPAAGLITPTPADRKP
jgi:hypothetical protein